MINMVKGWGFDALSGWVGDETKGMIADAMRMMTMWVLNALAASIDLMIQVRSPGVLNGGANTAAFNGEFLTRDWFQTAYKTMQLSSAGLALLALMIGIVTAAYSGNGWLLIKRMSLQILKWYALTFFIVEGTVMALEIFGEMEAFFVSGSMGGHSDDLFGPMTELHAAAGESGALQALLVTVMAMALSLMSLLVVMVLFIRDAALALVLLFAPLVSILLLTSYSKGVAKYMAKLAMLVMFKFLLVAGMTLGSAAMMSSTGVSAAQPWSPAAFEPQEQPGPGDVAEGAEAVADAERAAVGGLVMDMLKGGAVMGMALITPAFITSVIPIGGSDGHADKGTVVTRTVMMRAAAKGRR